MHLYKTTEGVFALHQQQCYRLSADWDSLINQDDLYESLVSNIASSPHVGDATFLEKVKVLAPISSQEVWAAGVTYLRSREARMEEAQISGGSDFYAKVYEADRPELFFKSSAQRCIGTGGSLHIRRDSKWNVPEPELTLFATSSGKIVAYTIGNDMSSRDIEGENPLYLPQAKCYDRSTALGPCLYVPKDPISPNSTISMVISRGGLQMFTGTISISQMKRSHTELIEYLFKETSFPHGAFLMTGTCLVPDNEFTLAVGDVVQISIEHIGTLTNSITKKD